jgi:hypothetical protein
MDTKSILEITMIKCAVAFDRKNINAWCDTKTHGQLATDITKQLYADGYCLQKINNSLEGEDNHLEDILT